MAVQARCVPGSIVLDPFCGSCSILMSCAVLGATTVGIDVDAEPGAYAGACPTDGIVVEARMGGLRATVRIPVSGDARHSPIEVARATTRLGTFSYFDES